MYSDRRVYINANDLVVGSTAKLTYNGELANNSEEIYVHLGYGLQWENVTEIKMSKANNQYIAYIPVMNADRLNFCFRNNMNEWDNNLNSNYSYEIKQAAFATPKQQYAATLTNITPYVSQPKSETVKKLTKTTAEKEPSNVINLETITTADTTNKTGNINEVDSTTDIAIEIACEPVNNISENLAKEIDIEIACADETTLDISEEIHIEDETNEPVKTLEEDTKPSLQKTYADLTAPIAISTKKSSDTNINSNKVKPWKTTQNYSEDDDVCLNIANIAINNTSKQTKIACNSIDIENVHKISADNFLPNSTVSQITTNIASNEKIENYSTIPTNLSLAPMRKVSEDYLNRKRMKIALYRVFAYIPRMVTGNGRKNRNLWR